MPARLDGKPPRRCWTPEQRFWKKVDKNGPVVRPELGPCWMWTGAKRRWGYGNFWLDGRNVYPHRWAWEQENGRPFPPELKALHACDTKACIRPSHVRPGTDLENCQDMIAKGRGYNTKMNPDKVRELRRLRAEGVSAKLIGRQMKTSETNVLLILKGKTWRHVS